MESFGDIGIELDVELLLDCQLLIPILASLVDPCLKWFTHNGEDDVANVGSWQLPDLSQRWEGIHYLLIRQSIVQDLLQLELLILRHIDHLHLITMNGL